MIIALIGWMANPGVAQFNSGKMKDAFNKTKDATNKTKDAKDKTNDATNKVENTTSKSTDVVNTGNDEYDETPDSAKIIFSDEPFKAGQTTGKKDFKPGQRIYGRLILKKALKNYEDKDNGDEIHCITFYINNSQYYYDQTHMVVKEVSADEINSSVIDFDVICNKGQRKDRAYYYDSFAKYIYDKQYANKKAGFMVKLSESDGQCGGAKFSHRYKKNILSHSEFTIDFTKTDEEALKKLFYQDISPAANASETSNSELIAVTTDYTKKVKLPEVFSTADGKGYRDPKCSKENIEALILKTFNTDKVLYFRFIESGSTADYGQRSAWRGGHEKVGEQKFLFAYKDKDDGVCRFACAVIVRYMGYSSVAGDPEILTVSVFETDTRDDRFYPHDLAARDIGIQHLYFVDENKIKK
ncbi:MAG: hypothetical protein ACHQF2_00490 [Flavobacteriales bacterium]